MKFLKKIVMAIMTIVMTGCIAPPPKYTGPGSFQDFANARYQCVRETSARVSGAAIGQYGGSAKSSVMPSCSAFTACLASKGYYESQNGKFDAASIGVNCN
jgi:hypothetical protein